REIASGVEQLLAPDTFAEFHRNAEKYSNRALFEIPQVLETIFEKKNAESPTLTTFAAGPEKISPQVLS
ncbi:MAG TPA: hypothetical protein VLK33_00475, partial [Terriglobales bacterium]|nr:hypothetical protein [Terriglobales bacterium]